jgi:hypothetical protein
MEAELITATVIIELNVNFMVISRGALVIIFYKNISLLQI